MSWIEVNNSSGIMRINTNQITRYYDTSPKRYGTGQRDITSVAIQLTGADKPFFLPISARDLSNAISNAQKFGWAKIETPEEF